MRVSFVARMERSKMRGSGPGLRHSASQRRAMAPSGLRSKSYRQHVHQAYRLLAPVSRNGGAHAALDRLLDRLRIAAAALGQVLDDVDRRIVGDLEHRLAVGIGL